MDGIPIGPVLLRWNGLLIIMGFAAGGILAAREVRRKGFDTEILLELVVPLLIWGTLGARLWHILTPPLSSVRLGLTTTHYLTHPLDLISIWVGGLGFPGVILGGSLGLYIFCSKYGLHFPEWTDFLAQPLALGYGIGRLGNFINQELYGPPTDLPWGIYIAPENRLPGFENMEFFHPLFAYDSILSVVCIVILAVFARRSRESRRMGDLYLCYLFLYGFIRFSLEYLRLDVSLVHGVNINQVFAAFLMAGSTILYLVGRAPRREL